MTAWPHEYRLQVWRTFYFGCRRIVERRIVYGAYDLARGFVAQGEEVREVILTECGIVTLQPRNASVPLCRRLVGKECRIRDGLHPLAVFLPLFVCLFLFCCCCHILFI